MTVGDKLGGMVGHPIVNVGGISIAEQLGNSQAVANMQQVQLAQQAQHQTMMNAANGAQTKTPAPIPTPETRRVEVDCTSDKNAAILVTDDGYRLTMVFKGSHNKDYMIRQYQKNGECQGTTITPELIEMINDAVRAESVRSENSIKNNKADMPKTEGGSAI